MEFLKIGKRVHMEVATKCNFMKSAIQMTLSERKSELYTGKQWTVNIS